MLECWGFTIYIVVDLQKLRCFAVLFLLLTVLESLLVLAALPLVNLGDSTRSSSPAPGLEGVASSLVQVSLHGDAIWCISIEIHDGVVVRHVLGILQTDRVYKLD